MKEKRKHTYDDHPPAYSKVKDQYAAYKLLKAAIRCKAHNGHCYMESTGGQDNHQQLLVPSIREITVRLAL